MSIVRFRALNADDEDEEVVSKEVEVHCQQGRPIKREQVVKGLEEYNRILAMQKDGRLDECKAAYQALLEHPVFDEELAKNVKNIHDSPMHALHYVVNKNYAEVLGATGNCVEAITFYQKAVAIDPSDSNVWMAIGHLGARLRDLSLSCTAYKMALSYSLTKIEECDVNGHFGQAIRIVPSDMNVNEAEELLMKDPAPLEDHAGPKENGVDRIVDDAAISMTDDVAAGATTQEAVAEPSVQKAEANTSTEEEVAKRNAGEDVASPTAEDGVAVTTIAEEAANPIAEAATPTLEVEDSGPPKKRQKRSIEYENDSLRYK
ncbi:Calcineurin-binding protein cabin-1 [Irineochytrium annulatum]|nr:Calcineurin-binding protein cabin-1 [Irineochytrium annulatum]